jgi:hypothetical protein
MADEYTEHRDKPQRNLRETAEKPLRNRRESVEIPGHRRNLVKYVKICIEGIGSQWKRTGMKSENWL